MVENKTAKSYRDAARKIAAEIGEPFKTVECRITRGKKLLPAYAGTGGGKKKRKPKNQQAIVKGLNRKSETITWWPVTSNTGNDIHKVGVNGFDTGPDVQPFRHWD